MHIIFANFIVFYFNKIENNFTRIIAWLGYTGLGTVSLLFFMQISVDIILIVKSIFIRSHHFDPNRRAFLGLTLKGVVGSLGVFGTAWGLYNAVMTPVIKKILTHLGLSPIPPPLAPARCRELFVSM